ncbi:CYTH domain-containing protein [uncultured Ferrimonas sp.]|uniref:CYTH domain-containing protein n=1 Tax=uncultured Ferrimonas sp. TaxID=432640 RepID=UPI0026393A03|nr:CYTH domain-containing protein [uncultured Ferrimonas sp.]
MEIEIKLLLAPTGAYKRVCDWQLPSQLQQQRTDLLGNIYFDTPAQTLRKLDMGLRIRRRGTQREMTLKTAGKVCGGLHARPEYNVDVAAERPDLSLFESGLFSPAEVARLNAELVPLFATDFERQQGVLQIADATVELALDQGSISAEGAELTIAELELELIEGEAKALLPLVATLMQQQPLRLGLDSKAARGYRLAQLQAPAAIATRWPASADGVLSAWQRNEERLLAGEIAALAPLLQLWQQAQHWLDGSEQQWLAQAQQQLQCGDNGSEALARLLQQPQYGLCQLALLRAWLLQE